MKKITLALALLLAVGMIAVSAQELTATVSGSATATVGFDLDSTSFGIVNSATSDVSLTLASGDVTTEAADGWYGEVSLTGMKLALDYASGADFVTWSDGDDDDDAISAFAEFDTGDSGLIVTAPTVKAKITNGSIDIIIWALDGFSVDVATEVENGGSDISVEDDDSDISTDLSNGSGGATIALSAGPADIKIYFATETGYSDEDSADNAHFLIGSDIDLTAGPADIGLDVVRGIGVDETLGIGVTFGVGAGPLDLDVAADLQQATGTFDYEVRVDTGLTFGDYGADIAVFYADDLDVEISSSPAVGPLTLSVLVGLYDLTTTLAWGIDLGTTFDLNDMITVSLDVAFDSATVVPVTLKAVITEPIPNVTMTAQYTTDDVAGDDPGELTFATKISY